MAGVAREAERLMREAGVPFAQREGIRAVLEKLEEVLEEGSGGVVFARLPTGYGKSKLIPFLADALYEAGPDYGIMHVIHVLPMRSILEDLYGFAAGLAEEGRLRNLEKGDIAYQASTLIPGGVKDALFTSPLVYTTLDSYTLNYARVTPLRTRRASYEAARAAIYTSLTVFDEVHLFAEAGAERAYTALATIASSLVDSGLPVLYLSATTPAELVEVLARRIGVWGDERRCKVVTLDASGSTRLRGCDELVVRERYRSLEAEAEPLAVDRLAEAACREAREDRRVVVVANTVARAIGYYERIRRECSGVDVTLLHGRLVRRDREEAVEAAKGPAPRVLVATQVVEAGVDLDYDTLISEPAPLAQLVQRAGRLCRSGRGCEPRIYIVDMEPRKAAKGVYPGSLTEETVRAVVGSRVEWRMPDSTSPSNHLALLERLYSGYYRGIDQSADIEVEETLETIDRLVALHRREAERLLERLCGVVRDSVRVTLVVGGARGECSSIEECWGMVSDRLLDVSLDYLNGRVGRGRRRYAELLDVDGEGDAVLVALVAERMGDGGGGTAWRYRLLEHKLPLRTLLGREGDELDCTRVQRIDAIAASALRATLREEPEDTARLLGVIGFAVPGDRYEAGVGLRVDRGAGEG